MKKILVPFSLFLYLTIACCAVSAQDFKTVRNGIEYAEMTREIGKFPVKMNLLKLDLTKVRLDVVHAMDAAIGTETTSSMAIRHGAFAAINAGFFRLDKSIFAGDAAGVLQIDGKFLSEDINKRIAILIENKPKVTNVYFENLNLLGQIFINGKSSELTGINRERKQDDLLIFTPEFNRSTLTNSNGVEVIVKNGKITQILNGTGSNLIPSNGYIISVSGKYREEILKLSRINRKVDFFYHYAKFNDYLTVNSDRKVIPLTVAEDITNGVPQLIKNGKSEITWEEEKSSKSFVETKHPRTAVAKLKDGKFLMVTVDGRSEASGGIGLEDLAKILLELGATDAMNLDGGGSSTMFLDGKVVNHPSDKEGERKVGDAILVTPRD